MIYYITYIRLKGISQDFDNEINILCQSQRNDDFWFFKYHRNAINNNELIIETNHHFTRTNLQSHIKYIYNRYHDKCDSITVEVWDDFEGTPDEPMKLTGTIETEADWEEFLKKN